MSRDASTVQIMVGDLDVTHNAVARECSFDASANALPGNFKIVLKDPHWIYASSDFITGTPVKVYIDGELRWGGPLMGVARRHFFSVVDTTDMEKVHDRQWALTGPDWNILFDRRIQRNTADYKGWIANPAGSVGSVIRHVLPRYYDVDKVPTLDTHSFVDNTDVTYPKGLMCGQGTYLRQQMEDFAQYGGAVYYADAAQRLHFHSYENARVPWHFTDWKPDRVKSIPFREASVEENGFEMITDALVWGGSDLPGTASDKPDTPAGSIVFARYPDPPANDELIHGEAAWTAQLSSNIGTTETEWPVTELTGTPRMGTDITVDLEKAHVTDYKDGKLQVDRGQEGTPPMTHAALAHIVHTAVPDVMLHKEREQEAIDNQDRYGRWQQSEQHAGQSGYLQQESVDQRAYTMISGSPGTDPTGGATGGLDRPVWTINLSWFDHDVPNGQTLYVGYIVQMFFYTMGRKNTIEDDGKSHRHPLILTLPCRSIHMTFAGLKDDGTAYVRYDAEFGIAQSDSRFLWRYLLKQQGTALVQPGLPALVDTRGVNSSGGGSAAWGSRAHIVPREAPNGRRIVFTLPVPYQTGSTEVYLNGLLQRLGMEYTEQDPIAGTIAFGSAPASDDNIYVNCITGEK